MNRRTAMQAAAAIGGLLIAPRYLASLGHTKEIKAKRREITYRYVIAKHDIPAGVLANGPISRGTVFGWTGKDIPRGCKLYTKGDRL